MFRWLKSLFSSPKPTGPPQTLRKFDINLPTLAKDGVQIEDGCWRIDAQQKKTIRLYDVKNPGVEQCKLTYQADIKTENLQGRTYLEMWCGFHGRGEFFSKGLQQAVSGTTAWARYEIPFFLKKGEKPDIIKLNLVIEGIGIVWLRDLEVLQTPLA